MNDLGDGATVDFRILGPVEVHDPRTGARIVPSGPKQRTLLAALVVGAGQVISADRLIDELWGDLPPVGAANALQAHVARLRRLLSGDDGPEWISTRPQGYLLHPPRVTTDAHRFHVLSSRGRATAAADPVRAAGLLREALRLWRGPALEGTARGPICAVEADRLEELRLTTLEALYETRLCGVPQAEVVEVVEELERLTEAHPVRERFYELLMLALHRSGRQPEALGVYERARRRLRRELGVSPGPALRGLLETVAVAVADRGGGPPHGGADFGPAAGAAALLDLGGEIARLRERMEALAREQEKLIRRFDRLTAGVPRG